MCSEIDNLDPEWDSSVHIEIPAGLHGIAPEWADLLQTTDLEGWSYIPVDYTMEESGDLCMANERGCIVGESHGWSMKYTKKNPKTHCMLCDSYGSQLYKKIKTLQETEKDNMPIEDDIEDLNRILAGFTSHYLGCHFGMNGQN